MCLRRIQIPCGEDRATVSTGAQLVTGRGQSRRTPPSRTHSAGNISPSKHCTDCRLLAATVIAHRRWSLRYTNCYPSWTLSTSSMDCVKVPSGPNASAHDPPIWHSVLNISCVNEQDSPKATENTPPIANTSLGLLRGLTLDGVHAFLGVPYSEPTERFAPAKPKLPWTGIKDAVIYGARCAQPGDDPNTVVGGEECHYLNVFAPSSGSGPFPVAIYLHGGGLRPCRGKHW